MIRLRRKAKFHILEPDQRPEIKWWSFSLDEIWHKLESTENGLEIEEVNKRQQQYGLNILPSGEKGSIVDFLFDQIKSPLMIVSLLAVLVSLFLKDLIDASIILLAVVVNIVVGFWQEWRTEKVLDSLKKVVVDWVRVKRDGHERLIETKTLVPGDVVFLSAGDKVPADLRLFKINDLRINEAVLTGEAEPRDKSNNKLSKDVILAERTNLAFMGTLVVQGNAHGLVVETGENTALGRIASLVSNIKKEETPLQQKLNRFAFFLTHVILWTTLVVFLIGLLFGYSLREMFVTAVAIAVSAIPEGLAVTVTVILVTGVQKILKQNALVRKLLAAEVLGSTDVICVDKTGTITEGNMQVVKMVTEDTNIDLKTGLVELTQAAAEEQIFLLTIGVLCNNAYVIKQKDKLASGQLTGNLTEQALLSAGINLNLDKVSLEKKYPRVDEIPFDPRYKFMMTLHKYDMQHNIVYLKGAPEKVLFFSNYVYAHHSKQHLELNTARREKFIKHYEEMSKQGLRVLALGYKKVPAEVNSISNQVKLEDGEGPKVRQAMAELYTNFVLVGLVGIKDPLREHVAETIKITRQAGISTVIITGDNKFTAKVIAQEAGLDIHEENILEGEEVDKMSESELIQKVKKIKVYARTTPEQKLKIVKAWQEQGAVVAMTGDGINDSPALKQANIGVALGTANDVAREAADIVLLDNNFKTILEAVRQGRIIFANAKKIVLYYLSDSFTEILVIVMALIFKWPLPILASQIIWVNFIDDVFPALALTQDPSTHDVMQDKPTQKDDGIVDGHNKILITVISLLCAVLILLTFLIFWQGEKNNFALANTMAFTLLAATTLIYLFSIRDLKRPVWKTKVLSNKFLLAGVAIGFVMQILAVYNPFLQKIFSSVALNVWQWVYVIVISLLLVAVIEFIKRLFNKKV